MLHLLREPLPLFIAQATTIIVVSRGIGLLARRLKQPMVVAEVVAGVVLGPSLLGWVAPGVGDALFPRASLPLLGMLSQVGLVLFMFLIGLELDPKLLKGRAHTSVAISHTSIVVPFALGGALSLYLYPRLSPPTVPFASFVLFMGVAMSITAFPVLARILVERRLLRSRVGAITIACAAVDDVTAWCILAFVVSIVRSSNVAGAAVTTLLALMYIGVMVGVVRPFIGRFAELTKAGLSQNIVALVLVLLLASSWMTELIGIHALFGAFLFGAILPKEGSFAAALAEKLEDLVVVFMLPLFFAYSGLRTQLGLLSTPGAWVICALIIGVACLGKFGGSFVAARLTGLSWRESGAIGILMNTRGLMELVVLNIGLDLGVISPTLFTMMVIMALVTTFATTPLLQRIYPLEELARELVAGAETQPPVLAARRFTALVCVAFERSGPGLVTLGGALAGGVVGGGRVYALRLVRPTDRASFVLDRSAGRVELPEEDAGLAPLFERARAIDADVRPLAFVSVDPARDICDVADVKAANIILLGWHKPVLATTMLSGTVHDVMSSARCDVGVLVDRGLDALRRVLVPYTGSTHDKAALRVARRIAENTRATVTILHVVARAQADGVGAREQVEGEFRELAKDGAYEVLFSAIEHDAPIEAVLDESRRGYDLVVVGIGKQWGLEHRSFGPASQEILRRSPASVLVVRAAELAASAVAAARELEPSAV